MLCYVVTILEVFAVEISLISILGTFAILLLADHLFVRVVLWRQRVLPITCAPKIIYNHSSQERTRPARLNDCLSGRRIKSSIEAFVSDFREGTIVGSE
ncbi:hypothetical protein L1987_36564 [Smallanthus sonchifolius]|uniref:Uncharacterized protein n=1 Tax=Smallanthus sonchifolius TaxID=185202 RepID=A0ACB9HEL6_9ASTR|nr:hypothetical protein L1987_36564 [Smallanthus sonchifolius]